MVGRPRGCRIRACESGTLGKRGKTFENPWGGVCSENDLPLLVGFHIEVGLQVSMLGENMFFC